MAGWIKKDVRHNFVCDQRICDDVCHITVWKAKQSDTLPTVCPYQSTKMVKVNWIVEKSKQKAGSKNFS